MRTQTRAASQLARLMVVLFFVLSVACGGRSDDSDQAGSTAEGEASAADAGRPGSAQEELPRRISTAFLGASGAPAQVADRYAILVPALREIRDGMARHTFDTKAVVSAVGSEPAALFAWVRDNTRLVPYRGVLRGPKGVLLDRVGNSLDRALLLSELLRLGGHTSRIAVATLPPGSAAPLAKQLSAPPPVSAITDESVDEAIVGLARRSNADIATAKAALAELRAAAAAHQRRAIERAGGQVNVIQQALASSLSSSVDSLDDTTAALSEHAWVQVRQSGGWADLDPVFLPQGAGQSPYPVRQTFEGDAVPADLYHTVKISLLIDRLQGAVLETVPVLQHELRVSDVVGVPIKLVQAPLSLPDITHPPAPGANPAALGAALSSQTTWVPSLVVGPERISQLQFNLTGETSKAGSAVKKPEKGLGGFGSFGGGSDDPAESKLAAQHLEYEIKVPGASTHVVRRSLFDWVDPGVRSAPASASGSAVQTPVDAAVQVVHETALLVLGSGLSDEFVEHAMLDALVQRGSLMAGAIRDPDSGSGGVSQSMKRTDASLEPRLLALALARFAFRTPDLPVFVAQPNILSLHRGVTLGPSQSISRWEAYDIVTNDVGVIPGASSGRLARLRQGVVDSNAESILAGSGSGFPGMSEVMHAGRLGADHWTVVTSAAAIPASIQLSSQARARLRAALGRGLIAILPNRTDDLPGGQTGWWEVDPKTGRTLAIDARGWGGQLAPEYNVTLGNVFVFLMEVSNGIFCYYKAAQGIATESTAGTACAFASCTASMVFAATGFMKVTVSQFVSPVLGLGWNICSALFPPPKK